MHHHLWKHCPTEQSLGSVPTSRSNMTARHFFRYRSSSQGKYPGSVEWWKARTNPHQLHGQQFSHPFSMQDRRKLGQCLNRLREECNQELRVRKNGCL